MNVIQMIILQGCAEGAKSERLFLIRLVKSLPEGRSAAGRQRRGLFDDVDASRRIGDRHFRQSSHRGPHGYDYAIVSQGFRLANLRARHNPETAHPN